MKTNLALVMMLVLVSGCGMRTTTNPTQLNPASSSPAQSASQTITIGNISTIPLVSTVTNSSLLNSSDWPQVNGLPLSSAQILASLSEAANGSSSYVTVINNSDSIAQLQNYDLTGDASVEQVASAYLNVDFCQKLQPHAQCQILVRTPSHDGSYLLALNYALSNSGKIVSAKQIINYTTQLPAVDGLIYSANNLTVVNSPGQNGAVTIPVSLAANFSSLSVTSSDPNLAPAYLSCAGGGLVSSNSCQINAQIEPNLGSKIVTLRLNGQQLNGKQVTMLLPLSVSYNQQPNLINNGMNSIVMASSGTTNVTLLNTGNVAASVISAVPSDPTAVTVNSSNCATIANNNGSCQLALTTATNSNKVVSVIVTYKNAISGSQTWATSFNVISLSATPGPGLQPSVPSGGLYILANGTESITTAITFTNFGSESLQSLSFTDVSKFDAGLSYINAGSNDCSNVTSLAPGKACVKQINYKTSNPSSGTITLSVIANYLSHESNTSLAYSPATVTIPYMAAANTAHLQIYPTQRIVTLSAGSSMVDVESFVVTNTGGLPTSINNFTFTAGASNKMVSYIPPSNSQTICDNGVLLRTNESCVFYMQYSADTAALSGTAMVSLNYLPSSLISTPVTVQAQESYSSAVGAQVVVSNVTVSGANSGGGIANSPWTFYNESNNGFSVKITYTNISPTYDESYFNLSLESLPIGITVDATNSNCGLGNSAGKLAANASCNVVLKAMDTRISNVYALNPSFLLPIPGFSFVNVTDGQGSVTAPYSNTLGSNQLALQPQSMLVLSTTQSAITSAAGGNFTVTFTASGGDFVNSANYPYTVTILGVGGGITGTSWCTISSAISPTNSCSLNLNLLLGMPKGTYPYLYQVQNKNNTTSFVQPFNIIVN